MSDSRRKFGTVLQVEQLEDRTTPSAGGSLTHGLLGLFYNNPNLQGAPVAQQISPTIDVLYKLQNGTVVTETPRMADGTPVGGYGENNFSVLWEGFLRPSVSGFYTFTTDSDDGIRLYIDHSSSSFANAMPLIDAFYPQPPTSHRSQPIWLEAGKNYPIRLEYNETNQGGAEVHLSWEAVNRAGKVVVPQEIVPNKNLLAQKKEAGKVEFQAANVKEFRQSYAKMLGDGPAEQVFNSLAAAYGYDYNKPDQVKKLEAATSLVQVKKDAGTIKYRYADFVRFASPNSTDSIIQVVNYKTVETAITGQKVETAKNIIEGWAIDKNGKAIASDQHYTVGAQSLDIAKLKSVRIEADFIVGSGLYQGKKTEDNTLAGGQGSILGFYKTFDTPDPKKVTWTGPTRTYKLVFEVDNQGNWSFTDESNGVKRKGTLTAGQGGQ